MLISRSGNLLFDQTMPPMSSMFDTPALVARLKKVRHFNSLPPTAIFEIVTAGQVQTHAENSIILHEGWDCAGLYVLFSGRVHLCKTSFQGQESIISVINPVIMFNEVAALDGDANPFTAIADQKCITWGISHQHFLMLIEKYPILGLSLLNVLAKRNRRLISKYEDLMTRPVKARTAKIILDLSDYGRQPVDRMTHTNQFLAASISTVPEAVSRSIKSLRESSVIETTRTQIIVKDAESLAELALVQAELI
jgi:CRP-like cAMP-binding protein